MKRKEIHFVIDCQGNVVSTINGIKGSSCKEVADEIRSLGRLLHEKRTEEYFAKEVNTCVVGQINKHV